jgi:hypothetical protein
MRSLRLLPIDFKSFFPAFPSFLTEISDSYTQYRKLMREMPEMKTFDFSWDFPESTSSGELEPIPRFYSHHSMMRPL